MKHDYLLLGEVVRPQGIHGEVKLRHYTDDPERFLELKTVYREREGRYEPIGVTGARVREDDVFLMLEGVRDRNAAEALRGTLLTVPRDALPALGEGEYYHADLIGLAAVSTDGAAIGRVVAVENFGAGDILEIEKVNGKRFMVPMIARAVPEWSADGVVVDAAIVE